MTQANSERSRGIGKRLLAGGVGFPDRLVGDILAKRWMDNAIPFLALILVIVTLQAMLPGFLSLAMVTELSSQFAVTGLIVLALTIVIISGGIDLSIGAVYGLAALLSAICMNVLGLTAGFTFGAVVLLGILCGGINGLLIGYLRLRAFLTTLVTLIIFRSIYELLFPKFSTDIIVNMPESAVWDFIGFGAFAGVPATFVAAALIVLAWHVVLTRMRPGWRIIAVGSARRSAHNLGINVRRTVFGTYVWSGVLCSIAGMFSAARLGGAGTDTGVGIEITALTAVVLGGISLGGGRGSVAKAVMGTIIILLLTNGMVALSVPGAMSSTILGVVLLAAVFLDARWSRLLLRISQKVNISPAAVHLPQASVADDEKVIALDAPTETRLGAGQATGTADAAFDRNGNLYFGNSRGEILRSLAPGYERVDVFAHIGGHPRGMAFDPSGNLIVCVSGMGLHRVTPDGKSGRLADKCRSYPLSVSDQSRIRFANGLAITPDGRVLLTDSTVRFESHNWMADAMEGRGNGRILMYHPQTGRVETIIRGLAFPSGICLHPDGESVLFAERFGCRVRRHYFDGSKRGRTETVLQATAGYPGMISPSSDGQFWLALEGTRTPIWDLALSAPGFRRRLVRDCSRDNWLCPNLNGGSIVKFNANGEITETLMPRHAQDYSGIGAVREFEGRLYVAGERNGFIGRHDLAASANNGQIRRLLSKEKRL